jgi:hypothetical protein
LLAKPTGAVCNLDCSYCFFLSKEMLYPGSRFRMADDVLEAYAQPSGAGAQAAETGSGYDLGMAHDSPSREQICLYTDRLCLRAPIPRDAEAMHELFADPEVMHGLNRDPISELEETRAMIERGIGRWRTEGSGHSFSRPLRLIGGLSDGRV